MMDNQTASTTALPEGVTAETVTRYRVGPYRYTSLADALAQHRRQAASES